jgi:uncharacterized membrane protein YfcA
VHIYFPIAEVSANVFVIIGIGIFAGFLSNILGIGGGFVATPFLIIIGVPPYIATACATQQIVGSSLMGILTKLKFLALDTKLAFILALFGIVGSYAGVVIINILHNIGQADILISLAYIIVMTTTAFGILLHFAFSKKTSQSNTWIESLPLQISFPHSHTSISIIPLAILGIFVGLLTGVMGIGGGFVMVPLMTYALKLDKNKIIGTSLMQIFIISIFVTMMNIFKTESLDLLLGVCLICGGVVGSFFGNIVSKFIKFDYINFLLALLILLVSLFFVSDLTKEPNENKMFTLEAVR